MTEPTRDQARESISDLVRTARENRSKVEKTLKLIADARKVLRAPGVKSGDRIRIEKQITSGLAEAGEASNALRVTLPDARRFIEGAFQKGYITKVERDEALAEIEAIDRML